MFVPNEPPSPERPDGPESFSESGASPQTQPDGALVPPPRKPPTTVGAATDPLFPPNPRRMRSWRESGWQHRTPFAQLATEIFNTLDAIADWIAEELRVRQ